MTNTDVIITEFVREYMFKKSLNTVRTYVQRIRMFLKYANKSIVDIEPVDIETWIAYRKEKVKPWPDEKCALKTFFNFCFERGFSQYPWNQAEVFQSSKPVSIKKEAN